MTITIDLAPELEAELARQAASRGVGIDEYAASLIENGARLHKVLLAQSARPPRDIVEAIEKLKGFGKAHGLSLGGMTIRELRQEGRP
jgi:hypothetical protein